MGTRKRTGLGHAKTATKPKPSTPVATGKLPHRTRQGRAQAKHSRGSPKTPRPIPAPTQLPVVRLAPELEAVRWASEKAELLSEHYRRLAQELRRNAGVACTPQSPSLRATIAANVQVAALLSGTPEADVPAKAHEAKAKLVAALRDADVPAKVREATADLVSAARDGYVAAVGGLRVQKDSIARMSLLTCLHEALWWQDCSRAEIEVAKLVLDPHCKNVDEAALERVPAVIVERYMQQLMAGETTPEWIVTTKPPTDMEIAARALVEFRGLEPELACSRPLRVEDWLEALEVWRKTQGHRAPSRRKWDYLSEFAFRATGEKVSPITLKQQWEQWKKGVERTLLYWFGGSVQNVLHEQRPKHRIRPDTLPSRTGKEDAPGNPGP